MGLDEHNVANVREQKGSASVCSDMPPSMTQLQDIYVQLSASGC